MPPPARHVKQAPIWTQTTVLTAPLIAHIVPMPPLAKHVKQATT